MREKRACRKSATYFNKSLNLSSVPETDRQTEDKIPAGGRGDKQRTTKQSDHSQKEEGR